jgi:hypothetical protein
MFATARKSLCPSRFCNGINPVQGLVSVGQAERAQESAIANSPRCSACGCVYVMDPRGVAHILGILRIEGSHCRWITAYQRQRPKPATIEAQGTKLRFR